MMFAVGCLDLLLALTLGEFYLMKKSLITKKYLSESTNTSLDEILCR